VSTYFLSPAAEQDIDEIVTYLARENPKAALNLLNTLYTTMDKLADNPNLGHIREDLTNRPVRFWPFKWHYLIIYTDYKPIEIVRVLSGYRDITRLLASNQT
jgi:plasmid stabilization system protein ParE